MLLQIIGQTSAFDGGISLLLWWTHKPTTTKFGLKKLEASLYRVKCVFHILNRLGVDQECDGRTDGQTDRTDITIARSFLQRDLKL